MQERMFRESNAVVGDQIASFVKEIPQIGFLVIAKMRMGQLDPLTVFNNELESI